MWERSTEALVKSFEVVGPRDDIEVVASPFAIMGYTPNPEWGGLAALERLRVRLNAHKMLLMLDWIPNHMARDHRWTVEHPGYIVQGSVEQMAANSHAFFLSADGHYRFAHGRGSSIADVNDSGWTDTCQINIFHSGARKAIIEDVKAVARLCDGVRCDMAMLLLSRVFAGHWGTPPKQFADGAPSVTTEYWVDVISAARLINPNMIFLAETYYDHVNLVELGFDFVYDKILYDHLLAKDGAAVCRDLSFPRELTCTFVENHDEDRIENVTDGFGHHRAAAVVAFLCTPGVKFFNAGQLEGRRNRITMHQCNMVDEPLNALVASFYSRLLRVMPEVMSGMWRLGAVTASKDCNPCFQVCLHGASSYVELGYMHLAQASTQRRSAELTFDRGERQR